MKEKASPNSMEKSTFESGGETKTIDVRFLGFPTIYDFFQGDSIKHTFSGNTLMDLIHNIISHYGERVKEALWDQKIDMLDPSIQIMINKKYVKRTDLHNLTISQGDKVTFLKLLAGG